jgi:hypothetical protein
MFVFLAPPLANDRRRQRAEQREMPSTVSASNPQKDFKAFLVVVILIGGDVQ